MPNNYPKFSYITVYHFLKILEMVINKILLAYLEGNGLLSFSRKILIEKLSLLGIRGETLEWITLYLSDRESSLWRIFLWIKYTWVAGSDNNFIILLLLLSLPAKEKNILDYLIIYYLVILSLTTLVLCPKLTIIGLCFFYYITGTNCK